MKDAFFKTVLKQVADNPSSEICLELGDYYLSLEDYEEAVLWYVNAAYETQPVLDIHAGGDTPLNQLALCYDRLSCLMRDAGDDEALRTYNELANNYRQQADSWTMPEEL